MEVIEPTVRSILEDVVTRPDGTGYISNYADWVMVLRTIKKTQKSRVFVQLSVLAQQFLDAGCKPVAVSLAVLARIGLRS